jgi:DNA-binding XRE family transcriptional regulator
VDALVFLYAYAIKHTTPQSQADSLMVRRIRKVLDVKSIGGRIRELRGTMFQEQLASYLGISQGHLSKIERGKMAPSADVLVRLADRFGKSLDWIVRGK